MLKPELYKKTVNILFDAYFNDTLVHNNCYACACGNIVAANSGYQFVPAEDAPHKKLTWDVSGGKYHSARADNKAHWFYPLSMFVPSEYDMELAKKQIHAAGYTVQDFMIIERAFEGASKGHCDEDYMFNGLVAVLEVLKQIHQVDDNEPEVARFRQHHATKLQAI